MRKFWNLGLLLGIILVLGFGGLAGYPIRVINETPFDWECTCGKTSKLILSGRINEFVAGKSCYQDFYCTSDAVKKTFGITKITSRAKYKTMSRDQLAAEGLDQVIFYSNTLKTFVLGARLLIP